MRCPVCEVREINGVIEHSAGCLQDARDVLLKIMKIMPRDCDAEDGNEMIPSRVMLIQRADEIHRLLYGCSCSYKDDLKELGLL